LSLKNLFCCIRRNLQQCWSAVLISRNHSLTRLISFTKNGSNGRSILSLYGSAGGLQYFAGHSAGNYPVICINQGLMVTRAELFDQSRRKIRLLRKKIRSPSNFPFLKEFGLKKDTIFVCLSGKISIFLGHFPINREDKRRETILLKFGPFSALLVQNRPKFGRRIVRPLIFIRPFFTYAAEQSAS
jgi:hypothetical protein